MQDLPDELLTEIFSRINPIYRPRISGVNRKFRAINNAIRFVIVKDLCGNTVKVDRFKPPFCWNSDIGVFEQRDCIITRRGKTFITHKFIFILEKKEEYDISFLKIRVEDFESLVCGKLDFRKYFDIFDPKIFTRPVWKTPSSGDIKLYDPIVKYLQKQKYLICNGTMNQKDRWYENLYIRSINYILRECGTCDSDSSGRDYCMSHFDGDYLTWSCGDWNDWCEKCKFYWEWSFDIEGDFSKPEPIRDSNVNYRTTPQCIKDLRFINTLKLNSDWLFANEVAKRWDKGNNLLRTHFL